MALAALFAAATSVGAQTTERLTLQGSVGRLAAIVEKPQLAAGQTCDMVMLLHGFGGTKDAPMMEHLADSLVRRGVASIRFDFNGHGQSEGEFVNMTVPNEIDDALQVYRYVRRLSYVRSVSMVGHSQGGVVASMAAGQLGTDSIATLVLMAPAAVLREDAIRGNTMGSKYNPLDPPEYVTLFGRLKLGRAYIQSAFSLPIYETAARYQGPACMVHGTGDVIVPYTYSLRYMETYRHGELYLMEGEDHGFSRDEPTALGHVAGFVARQLKAATLRRL